MSDSDHEINADIVARGDSEKQRIRQRCWKNQRTRVATFFQEFRGFCKNSTSNRHDELNLLNNELEHTLNPADKEYLIKQWKPTSPPIILISSMDQMHEIRSFLNGLELPRINSAMSPPNNETPIVSMNPNKGAGYQTNIADEKNSFNIAELCICPVSPNNDCPVCETSTDDQYNFLTNSTEEQPSFLTTVQGRKSPDLAEAVGSYESNNAYELSKSLDEILGITNGPMEYLDELNSTSITVDQLFYKLSEIIDNKGDILTALTEIKNNHDQRIHEEVLRYSSNTREPIIFQLLKDFDFYHPVVETIRMEGLLDLNQRNSFNISIFYFLIMTNIELLYKFLRYTKDKNLQSEVIAVCSSDEHFKRELNRKKKEMSSLSIQSRRKLDSMTAFCLNR